MSVILERSRSNPVSFIYWTRAVFAIIVSALNVVFQLTDIPGIVMGVGVYLLSYYVFRYVLRIRPEMVGGTTKLYTIGVGAYTLLWLFFWTFLYTISHTAS